MSFFDKIKDKLIPDTSNVPISTSASGGIGNRRGTLDFEDDVSRLIHFGTPCHNCCASASQPRAIFEHIETALRNHVRSLELLPMSTSSDNSIVFLLIIPILWVLWLWVHALLRLLRVVC
jgi:hypothetical protein